MAVVLKARKTVVDLIAQFVRDDVDVRGAARTDTITRSALAAVFLAAGATNRSGWDAFVSAIRAQGNNTKHAQKSNLGRLTMNDVCKQRRTGDCKGFNLTGGSTCNVANVSNYKGDPEQMYYFRLKACSDGSDQRPRLRDNKHEDQQKHVLERPQTDRKRQREQERSVHPSVNAKNNKDDEEVPETQQEEEKRSILGEGGDKNKRPASTRRPSARDAPLRRTTEDDADHNPPMLSPQLLSLRGAKKSTAKKCISTSHDDVDLIGAEEQAKPMSGCYYVNGLEGPSKKSKIATLKYNEQKGASFAPPNVTM